MQATRPKVSVAIPSYMYGRFLRGCVDSVLSQVGVDVEVVIVDNASPDSTAAIAHDIAAQDERVRVIAREQNLGHISAFNEGMDAATAEYAVLLCADDMLSPGSLARSTAVLEAHPEVGLVHGFVPYFSTDPPPAAKTRVHGWRVWQGAQWLERVCARGHNVVLSPSAVMRTSVLRAAGGFEPQLPHTSDFFLWMCAAAHSSIAYVSGPHQAFYRLHGTNMSFVEHGTFLGDITERHRAFELFFDRYANQLPDAARLRELASTAMAREALTMACRWHDGGLAERDDPAALAELAATLSPGMRGTRLWRAYEWRVARRARGRPRLPHQVGLSAFELVRRRVDSRWARHFGVEP